MSNDDEFLAARSAVDRGACERWVRVQPIDQDAAAVDAAKGRWRNLPLLGSPSLAEFSRRVLAQSAGPLIIESSPFPATIWYGGATDTYGGVRFTGTIADFIKHVLEARAQEIAEKRCGWVVTPTSNTDGHRVNASTTAMHAINLDCDGRGQWDMLLSALRALGFAFIAYQSGGWTPQTQKWHILLPLSQPFDTSTPEKIASWKAIYNSARVVLGAVAGLLGEGFDPTVESPVTPIFITERRKTEDPPREVVWWTGRALDLMSMAVALPEIPEVHYSVVHRAVGSPIKLDDARLEQIVATLCVPMANILSGRRELYMALPGALLDRRLAPNDVRTIIEEISTRCPGDPRYTAAEVASKHREHVHCAETTIAKWERREEYTRIGTIADRWPEVAKAYDDVLPDPFAVEILDRLERQRAGTSPAGNAPHSTILNIPAAPAVDLAELRSKLVGMRRNKRNSDNFHDKVKGEIVNALLEGDDLVPYCDGEPVPTAKGGVYDRDKAITVAMGMIAYGLPITTPFDAVRELCRGSLHAMLKDGEKLEDLMKTAKRAFEKSLVSKVVKEEKRAAEDEARRSRMTGIIPDPVNKGKK